VASNPQEPAANEIERKLGTPLCSKVAEFAHSSLARQTDATYSQDTAPGELSAKPEAIR
jgi:hypothetical protein